MAEDDGRTEASPTAPPVHGAGERPAVPDADVAEEVRLAVVLYGGSSLAIYINGMVQELFKLVRATAVRPRREEAPGGGPGIVAEEPLVADADLSGTERVYRRLGCIRTADPGMREAVAAGQAHSPLGTRVVVDILSGSSAGGINGVFLAKALVGDLSLEALKRLWVDEGDVKTLIYDAASRVAPRLGSQTPVPSLLNGRRMYRLLLKALEGMESRDSSGRLRQGRTSNDVVSPYVDELDLYVTATDLQGLDQWLKLENTKAYERRHRNVFHFSYTHDPTVPPDEPDLEHHNDFHADNNPFLAFAARCTSSLPFVFEPMQLRDIESHLASVEPYASNPSLYATDGPVGKAWRRFYADYLPGPLAAPGPAAEALPFAERSFGDGGSLDNNPFSYSIDRLLRAQAARRIDRKLLYVEPDPAAPVPLVSDEPGGRGRSATSRFDRPNPLRNTLLQVVSLPRYQTIREDLQRVQDRNRLALRLQSLLAEIWPVPPIPPIPSGASPGGPQPAAPHLTAAPREVQPWVSERFAASAGAVAVSPQLYKGYIRLRAETVVQQLAILATRAVGLDEDSDDLLAMRLVVRAWRDHRYALPSSEQDAEGEQRVKDFLIRFDVDYRFRLVKFLQSSLDNLHPPNERGRTCLSRLGLPAVAPDDRGATEEVRQRREELVGAFWQLRRTLRLLRRVPRHPASPVFKGSPGSPGSPAASNAAAEGSPLLPLIEATGLKAAELRLLLSEPTPERQRDAAAALMANPARAEAFDALGEEIARQLALSDTAGAAPGPEAPQDRQDAVPSRSRTIGARVRAAVSRAARREGSGDVEPAGWAQAIDTYLRFHRDSFDSYDVVALPLLYGTPLGEIDEVDVIRMSPREATSLIDEQESGRPKLGGASVGHLGGFFYDRWRRNDIMWGRLDAAECLIEALVPPGPEHDAVAETLRWDAHRRILEEELSEEDRRQLASRIGPAAGTRSGAAPAESGEPAGAGSLAGLTREEASAYFRTTYETGSPPTQQMMRSAGRGMHVTGKVLQGVAESDTGGPEVMASKALRKPTQWFALLGSLLTGMVEVAVSGPRHLIFHHIVASLFLFEIVMLGLGIVLGLPAAAQLGTTALALTLLATLAVWVVRVVVEADGGIRRRLIRIGAVLCAAVIVAVVGLAIAQVRHLAKEPPGPLRTVQCWVGRCPAATEGPQR